MKKLSKLFICLIVMMLFAINAISIYAAQETRFMELTLNEWEEVLKTIKIKVCGTDYDYGDPVLSESDNYLYTKAKEDYDKKKNESILKQMEEKYGDSDISTYLHYIETERSKEVAPEVIKSPEYSSDSKKTFNSTDKRYWVKMLMNVYYKQNNSQNLTQQEKKDLDILIKLKDSGYDFPTITKVENTSYTRYYPSTIVYFRSFEQFMNVIDYIKDNSKKNEEGTGSTENPGNDGGSGEEGKEELEKPTVGGKLPIGYEDGEVTTTIDPDKFAPVISNDDPGKATDLVGKIVGAINVIGTVIAIATVMILGIKYIFGSIEEKAEYKKTMWPILVGAILLFGVTWIINLIYQLVPNNI